MSLVVLLILAVVWGVFLVPQVLRARADRGPADSIGAFRTQLSVLDKTAGSATGRRSSTSLPSYGVGYRPPTRNELQRRRRDVFLGLLAGVIVTLALTLLFRPFLVLNLVLDAAFVGYVALLVRARSIAAEREMKVRYLPGPVAVPSQPAYASLRRSGTGS